MKIAGEMKRNHIGIINKNSKVRDNNNNNLLLPGLSHSFAVVQQIVWSLYQLGCPDDLLFKMLHSPSGVLILPTS
jgi:hypothetical protein